MKDIIKSGLLGLTFLGALAIACANGDVNSAENKDLIVSQNVDVDKEVKKEKDIHIPL